MNQMFTLTKRDKKLLVFLFFLLILTALFVFVMQPQLERSQTLSEEYKEARTLQEERQTKVSKLSGMEKTAKKNKKAYRRLAKKYYGELSTVEIDRLMTGMAQKRQVSVTSMEITMPGDQDEQIPVNYNDILDENVPDEAQTLVAGQSPISIARVTMELEGEEDSLQGFLNDLADEAPKQRLVEMHRTTQADRQVLSVQTELYLVKNLKEIRESSAQETTGE